ncbi:hypothetical protein A2U01_0074792, partial [Trifolium medium]|nr:hypothetical protein [Trifolium medium]
TTTKKEITARTKLEGKLPTADKGLEASQRKVKELEEQNGSLVGKMMTLDKKKGALTEKVCSFELAIKEYKDLTALQKEIVGARDALANKDTASSNK